MALSSLISFCINVFLAILFLYLFTFKTNSLFIRAITDHMANNYKYNLNHKKWAFELNWHKCNKNVIIVAGHSSLLAEI